MRLTDEARLCSTDGCLRACRPAWAVCETCATELLVGPPPARIRVERRSTMRFPASRPGHPDLAVDLGAGASRDEGARTEAPEHASRVSTSVDVGAADGADVGRHEGVGRAHAGQGLSPQILTGAPLPDPGLRAAREGSLSLASRAAPSLGPTSPWRPRTPARAVTRSG